MRPDGRRCNRRVLTGPPTRPSQWGEPFTSRARVGFNWRVIKLMDGLLPSTNRKKPLRLFSRVLFFCFSFCLLLLLLLLLLLWSWLLLWLLLLAFGLVRSRSKPGGWSIPSLPANQRTIDERAKNEKKNERKIQHNNNLSTLGVVMASLTRINAKSVSMFNRIKKYVAIVVASLPISNAEQPQQQQHQQQQHQPIRFEFPPPKKKGAEEPQPPPPTPPFCPPFSQGFFLKIWFGFFFEASDDFTLRTSGPASLPPCDPQKKNKLKEKQKKQTESTGWDREMK